jgi:malonyl-CoA O-methyltransferase
MPARLETVAQQFDQRARRIGTYDALLREVAARMLSRLEYIRLDPRRILDIGCGLGRSRDGLVARYPNALWHGIELSAATASSGRSEQLRGAGMARLWRKPPLWIVADGAQLPIADQSVDLVYSNLMLHWHPAPHRVLPEWKRVLRVDGLLMFSCFGPDTLAELRSAVESALPLARPMPFVDMHDFGDMLVASGFATPVMDVERITLTFATARALVDEVRALGSNPRDDRPQGLPSGRQARSLLAAIEERRDSSGRIPLTFEIAYGHAWRPAAATAKVSTVSVERLRAQLRDARPSR